MTISIITICYNPGSVIRSAVESVLGQSYSNVEYIIVDGGSTDGTVELLAEIKEHQTSSMTIVSEPDNGLYDALNKGVRLATGDVIGFVHADDFLAHPDVLQHVADRMEESSAEAVYGDLQYVAERLESKVEKSKVGESDNEVSTPSEPSVSSVVNHEVSSKDHSKFSIQNSPFNRSFAIVRHWQSGQYSRKKLRWGWMPPHPTLYLKRDVYDRAILDNGEFFDTSFSCAADYDFMMRVLSTLDVRPVYLPEVMVKMRVGGVSNRSLKHILRKSAEDWRAIRRNKIGHVHTLAWKNLSKVIQFFPGKKIEVRRQESGVRKC